MKSGLVALLLSCGLLLSAPFARGEALPDASNATPRASIWPRLVAGMRLEPEPRAEVRRFMAYYRSHPATFTTMLARAEPFLGLILAGVEQRGLPTELALLPAVESGWNPHAVSSSAAEGLWQFIARTGDAYGLKNALNYQARRDPVASTAAALELLRELHDEYGDWPLALAAYNTGGVRVRQAMRASGSRNFWRLPLPQVTRDYVPRLLAIAALVRQPELHGLTLPPIADTGVAELIALDHAMPWQLALDAAGIDATVFSTFNPALPERGAPTHSPTLLLPPADAVALRAELAMLQQARDRSHPQNLPPVAPMLPADLPMAASAPSSESPVRPASLRLHWDERIATSRGVIGETQAPAAAREYQVRRGDTLFAIARQHGLTTRALKRLNPRVATAPLRPGQSLRVFFCESGGCG